jgi:hypothetical protein
MSQSLLHKAALLQAVGRPEDMPSFDALETCDKLLAGHWKLSYSLKKKSKAKNVILKWLHTCNLATWQKVNMAYHIARWPQGCSCQNPGVGGSE